MRDLSFIAVRSVESALSNIFQRKTHGYSNYAPDYFYVTVRRHWVDQVVDLPFENMKLMAPAGWHQILAWLYGDYMTPPPEDKQVPTHSSMEIEVYEDVSLR